MTGTSLSDLESEKTMRKLLTIAAVMAIAASPLAAQPKAELDGIPQALARDDITIADMIERTVHVRTDDEGTIDWTEWTSVPDNWEAGGVIDDLIVGQGGDLQYVILSQGGILDLRADGVRVDIERFGVVGDADDPGEFFVIYIGPPAELENARSYEGPAEGQTSATSQPYQQGAQAAQTGAASGPLIADMTAEDLQGMPVYTSDGERVGEIGQLRLGEDGVITHAVVDMGGFLGLGETPVPVSLERLTVAQPEDGGELRAHVDMTEDEMRQLKNEANQ